MIDTPVHQSLAAALAVIVAPESYHRLPGLHEPFSAVSHLIGAALFLVLGTRLVARGGEHPARFAALSVYAAACVLLLATSGIYHATTPGGLAHRVMLRLDHSAIFVFIAATFTPIHALLFRGPMRWGALLFVWAVAAAGVVARTAYYEVFSGGFALLLYLGMGWLGAVSGGLLCRRHGYRFVRPLLWGGIAYSIGAIVAYLRQPVLVGGVIHAHELFHVAVLAGALLHFRFVWQFADGTVPATISRDPARPPAPRVGDAPADAVASSLRSR
jgi:channel protein (hemolysin III family)